MQARHAFVVRAHHNPCWADGLHGEAERMLGSLTDAMNGFGRVESGNAAEWVAVESCRFHFLSELRFKERFEFASYVRTPL